MAAGYFWVGLFMDYDDNRTFVRCHIQLLLEDLKKIILL